MSNLNKNDLDYLMAVNDAQAELDWGTDLRDMAISLEALRDLDPGHRLVASLEQRIRQVARSEMLMLRKRRESRDAQAA